MRRIGLRAILVLSLTLVFAVFALFFTVANRAVLSDQGQKTLLTEARALADEMGAVWKFMDYSTNRYEDVEAYYEESGLYCSIVGKGVGAIFSAGNKYKIRYTNFEPRNVLDEPDAFEAEALTLFNNDASAKEYYGISVFEGQEVFRYVRALEVIDSCLPCHGSPAGEIDVIGYPREGWTTDSVGGAISIAIPLDMYYSSLEKGTMSTNVFIVAEILVAFVMIFLVISFFIFRPLDAIKDSFIKMRSGNIDKIEKRRYEAREINELLDGFNDMAYDLSASYTRLEDQVQTRTHELTQVNEALELLNERLVEEVKYKSNFLSMVSHELRTPLTSILVFTQLLRDKAQDRHDEKEEKAWSEIEKNCFSLLGMINNMLGIARSDAGIEEASFGIMDLGDLVVSLRATLEPLAESAGVDFSIEVGSDVPLVFGDYEKTHRMIENLVNNAIKFTPEGKQVKLAIKYNSADDVVYIVVEDEGIGIAVEDQERVFERFVQVDVGVTRKFKGSGLGLALVKEYADLQNFSVLLESTPEKGSVFVIRIPAQAVVHSEEEEGEEEGEGE